MVACECQVTSDLAPGRDGDDGHLLHPVHQRLHLAPVGFKYLLLRDLQCRDLVNNYYIVGTKSLTLRDGVAWTKCCRVREVSECRSRSWSESVTSAV